MIIKKNEAKNETHKKHRTPKMILHLQPCPKSPVFFSNDITSFDNIIM